VIGVVPGKTGSLLVCDRPLQEAGRAGVDRRVTGAKVVKEYLKGGGAVKAASLSCDSVRAPSG